MFPLAPSHLAALADEQRHCILDLLLEVATAVPANMPDLQGGIESTEWCITEYDGDNFPRLEPIPEVLRLEPGPNPGRIILTEYADYERGVGRIYRRKVFLDILRQQAVLFISIVEYFHIVVRQAFKYSLRNTSV